MAQLVKRNLTARAMRKLDRDVKRAFIQYALLPYLLMIGKRIQDGEAA